MSRSGSTPPTGDHFEARGRGVQYNAPGGTINIHGSPGHSGLPFRGRPSRRGGGTRAWIFGASVAIFLPLLVILTRDSSLEECPPIAVIIHVKPVTRDIFLGVAEVRCPAPSGHQYQLFTQIFWPWQPQPVYYAGNPENQNIPSRRGRHRITLGVDNEVRRCYMVVALRTKVPAGKGSENLPGGSMLVSDEAAACVDVVR